MKKEKYSNEHTAIRICLDKKSNNTISGSIHSPFCKDPIVFQDVVTFFIGLEQIVEERGFPEPVFKHRSFSNIKKDTSKKEVGKIVRSMEEIEQEYGKCETLQFYVTGRKYAGLQGHFVCLSSGIVYKYKSELELLHLLEENILNEKSEKQVAL